MYRRISNRLVPIGQKCPNRTVPFGQQGENMTIENLEKELNNKNLRSLYLLYGEELFLLESNLKKIKTLFGECIKGINYILIDEQNVSEIISDIETPSFGYEKKLIIARNTGLFKKEGKKKTGDISKIKEKLAKYIDENIKIINESVILVFIEEEADNKSELYKTIEKNGVVCKFDYQKPLQIEQRIKAICNGYKVQIDSQTIRYFIECCGTNMQDLINEIRKLNEYFVKYGVTHTIITTQVSKLFTQSVDNTSIKNLCVPI